MGAPSLAFAQQYRDAITMLAQQMDSRVRDAITVDTNWTGEAKFYDQYSTDDMQEIISRLQDTPSQDPNHARRKVTPRAFVSNTLEDPFEAAQMLVDPKSAYMMAKQASMKRKFDNIVLAAAVGTAYTGKTGTTAVTLGAGQKITAGGTGLTKGKTITAKRIMDKNEVDKEDRFMVYSAVQLETLLATTEVVSSDYNTVKALVQGEIDQWVGFKFIHTEQLPLVSTTRTCIAFQKKGVLAAIQKEAEGRLDERADKNYAWQVYLRMYFGATRLEEERVVDVACLEA